MQLRLVQPSDRELLFKLYFKMFTDAPAAFGKTVQDAKTSAQNESAYTNWLAESSDTIGLLAYEDNEPCGFSMGCVGKLINGNLDDSYQDTVTFGRMWVDPTKRRRGIATALLQSVEDWTREKDIERLELWVTETNLAALDLYRKAGFEVTQKYETMTHLGNVKLHLMAKTLNHHEQ